VAGIGIAFFISLLQPSTLYDVGRFLFTYLLLFSFSSFLLSAISNLILYGETATTHAEPLFLFHNPQGLRTCVVGEMSSGEIENDVPCDLPVGRKSRLSVCRSVSLGVSDDDNWDAAEVPISGTSPVFLNPLTSTSPFRALR
jgi:hypothetical protein